jgi:hypothetical protein
MDIIGVTSASSSCRVVWAPWLKILCRFCFRPPFSATPSPVRNMTPWMVRWYWINYFGNGYTKSANSRCSLCVQSAAEDVILAWGAIWCASARFHGHWRVTSNHSESIGTEHQPIARFSKSTLPILRDTHTNPRGSSTWLHAHTHTHKQKIYFFIWMQFYNLLHLEQ